MLSASTEDGFVVVSARNSKATDSACIYRFPPWALAVFAALAVLIYLGFARAIDFMVGQWNMDEFSHGYLIPFISIFLVWRRRHELQRIEFRGSWSGAVVVLLGLGLNVAGRLASLYPVQHIALLLVIAGLVLALAGWEALRVLGPPLGVLIFMIPLPNILLNALSAELQLISSSFGVWLLRLANVTVLLEGNVIDLGSYKLEVAQACSGLRYLLPLMTLAFLIACFYRTALWKRIVLFLSSIPLTLVMNSLRIAAIGVMVDRWGPGMAEGLLHEVQGWMMFMLSTGALLGEMILLSKLGGDPRPWREGFALAAPTPLAPGAPHRSRTLSLPLIVGAIAVLGFSAIAAAVPAPKTHIPQRGSFLDFPLQIGEWSGRRESLDAVYLDALKLDDYLLADYVPSQALPGSGPPVNLYVAWYDTQHAGESTHSPKACLPGGGWRIDDLRQVTLPGIYIGAQPLRVNRALIQYGDQRQLVYYWFEQRGRVLTNEYLVKWYLLVDALFKHRTDGALVRLIVPLPPGLSANSADRELQGFARTAVPRLSGYIPG